MAFFWHIKGTTKQVNYYILLSERKKNNLSSKTLFIVVLPFCLFKEMKICITIMDLILIINNNKDFKG